MGCNGFEVGNIDAIESHRQRQNERNLKKFVQKEKRAKNDDIETHGNIEMSYERCGVRLL